MPRSLVDEIDDPENQPRRANLSRSQRMKKGDKESFLQNEEEVEKEGGRKRKRSKRGEESDGDENPVLPDLKEEDRHRQRKQLRMIKNDIQKRAKEQDYSHKQLTKDIHIAAEAGENVAHTREARIDATIYQTLSHANYMKIKRAVKSGSSYSISDFTIKLKENFRDKYNSGLFDWNKFGYAIGSIFSSVPEQHFLVGAIEKPVEKKDPVRRKEVNRKAQQEEMQKLQKEVVEELDQEGKTTEQITTRRIKDCIVKLSKNVRKDHGKLGRTASLTEEEKAKHENLDFFQYVINPRSYIQSMENIFDMSTAVSKHDYTLTLDKKNEESLGVPLITSSANLSNMNEQDIRVKLEKTNESDKERKRSKKTSKHQLVLPFNYQQYLLITEAIYGEDYDKKKEKDKRNKILKLSHRDYSRYSSDDIFEAMMTEAKHEAAKNRD